MVNRKNNSQLNQKILSMLYDFVLDPNIKDRERKLDSWRKLTWKRVAIM